MTAISNAALPSMDRLPNGLGSGKNTETARLLVVDDNEMNRTALSRLLQSHGYAVAVAKDGKQALDLIVAQRFDLVLLDVMMHDVSGMDVLQTLRRQHSVTDLPVIMTTARDQSEDIVAALKLGASDYVTKPLDFPVLLARIQTQLSLKRAVERILRLEKNLAQRNEDLEALNARISSVNNQMRHDLEAAARIQETFLPRGFPSFPGAQFAWLFKPCEQLAGDMLNVFALDDQHVGLYVLDVSGHGVAAALLSVAINRLLSPTADRSSLLVEPLDGGRVHRLVPPGEIARQLGKRFPWDPATEQYFTLLYGILDLETGAFRYISAGHPPPVYLPAGSGSRHLEERPGLPIGVGEAVYKEQTLTLRPGDRLYLYTDGLVEAMNPRKEMFGREGLRKAIDRCHSLPLTDSLTRLWGEVEQWCGESPPRDDVSMLALEFTGTHCAVKDQAP